MSKSEIFEWVFTSDFHLNKLARFFANHLELQMQELRKPFLYAIENGIDTVWVGGDISEDPVLDQPAIDVLQRVLIEFDGKLQIHIILGNHDFEHMEFNSLHSLLTLCKAGKFKTVHVYDKPTNVKCGPIHFNALPYPYAVDDKVWTKTASVNVAHIEWAGAIRDNGKTAIKDGYSDGDSGKDVWNIGHLHTPQYLKKPRVLYCGTLFQTNFGETSDKSFCRCAGYYDKDKRLRFKFERIPSRPAFTLENVKINTSKDFDKLSNNPLHLYKLWLASDVRLPKRLLIDYPNIISHRGQDIEEEIEEGQELGTELKLDLDKKKAVKLLLKKEGLDAAQLKRAAVLMKKAGISL